MLRILVYGLLWVLLMGVAIFATQNTMLVTIKFFTFESINLPVGLVLVFSAGLGAIATTVWQNMEMTEVEATTPGPDTTSATKQPSSYSAYRASAASKNSESSKSSASKSSGASAKNATKSDKFDDFDEEWDDDWG
ncbi:lipopolysaccharide assembly protein LapA domain-containing protein [Pseudanabaena sp. PCC 6802]|uniref:lipopolysaccharide assembly protein LapA domain-containing protein n=1 Tax=Pseudanabaena sp. PCC 6802 TaxID=118173 RepID=UPI0003494686|nr:LapA family protein [Pseudanabaena sp. PCC 6802]